MKTKRMNGQKFAAIIPAGYPIGIWTWYPVENLRWLRAITPFEFAH